jgi:hypothetical protein
MAWLVIVVTLNFEGRCPRESGAKQEKDSTMPEPEFKVVAGAADWGSPLSYQPAFKTLEEAQEAAREYIAEQKKMGGPSAPGHVAIEETRRDGTVVAHPIS